MTEQQYCTFFLNQIYFGLRVQQVQEVIRTPAITPVPLSPPDIEGLINLRGQVITVIDLSRRLHLSAEDYPNPLPEETSQEFNIIVQMENQVASLQIDQVGDVLTLPANKLEPPPATLTGRMQQMLSGAYSLPGEFLLILDVAKILTATA